jgi:hypothetical protein
VSVMGLKTADVGYYTKSSQAEPAYEPGRRPCPVCGEQPTDETVRTICVAPIEDRMSSAFYRIHRACSDGLTSEQSIALDEQAMRLANCRGASA